MFVMVKERYTGFQLHRVNDSDGLNGDDIDYVFAANGSIVKSIRDFKLTVENQKLRKNPRKNNGLLFIS